MASSVASDNMYEHFARLSTAYNDVRTTDPEPVLYIRNKLQDRESIRGADIGCGGGRYDLLLLQYLPRLHLICSDVNEAMVEETARYLRDHGQNNFTARRLDASDLQLGDNALDCILTFNAIHHFDPAAFLSQAEKALRDAGYIFIYTRLRSQNARTIWGRFFPGFTEKENRLYDLAQVERWADKINGLNLETVEFFKFKRVAPLANLLNQAQSKHYSTFSLYSETEFKKGLNIFKRQVERRFRDPTRVEWHDENAMLVFRKD